MRVRCIATSPSELQKRSLGDSYADWQQYDLQAGEEYDVLALWWFEASAWGRGCVVQFESQEFALPSMAPICLFEVTDNRLSSHWEFEWWDNNVGLGPRDFFRDHFVEDLANGDPSTVAEYRKWVRLITDECAQPFGPSLARTP